MTEDNHSVNESETLARGTGSFIVHGKKASVITFGSEWQSMSPEERLKLRKQAHADEGKPAAEAAVDDGTESVASGIEPVARTGSMKSVSTSTARSIKERPVSSRLNDSVGFTPDVIDDASAPTNKDTDETSYHEVESNLQKTKSSASDDIHSHLSEMRHSPQPQPVGA